MEVKVGKDKVASTWDIYVIDEFSSKKHWHNELEFIFLISGTLSVDVDGVVYDMEVDDLYK